MDKKLYMVSLGPGDSQLITIKALKALQNSDAICVPTKSADNSFEKSLTYKIVKQLMDEHGFEKKIIPVYTPMHFKQEDWQYQVHLLNKALQTNDTISFVTLGDSAVYSTVYYLLDIIKVQNKELYDSSEVIAGVTSFSQSSAKVKKPLCVGDSSFSIVPLLGKVVPNTTVYMRPKIGMSTDEIDENGQIYTFENLNYDGERITNKKIPKTKKYMTLFIDFFQKDN
ncbi:MAG: precorrin-2 C(20)-methyltransferase [Campylobacterota bacterium]|nr:precorrin-2 C(20)-methyltransferase [Campylobacterota bacterium]